MNFDIDSPAGGKERGPGEVTPGSWKGRGSRQYQVTRDGQ